MTKPEYVINVKPREPDWPERRISLPRVVPPPPTDDITDSKYLEWWKENSWNFDFSVHVSDAPRARELSKKLQIAYEQKDKKEIKELVSQLRPLEIVPFEKRTAQQKWSHMAVQMPGDIGGPNKGQIREILSARYQGTVLEAMCGFNSYLEPSPNREVIALDYCREALERYPYPKRKRILFDLNTVKSNGGMEFFRDGEFDVITICFGFDYLKHPVITFREFHRLLSLSGRLVLVENPHQGYSDIVLRYFSSRRCVDFLKRASFEKISVEELSIRESWEKKNGGRYFLAEAIKG